MKPLDDPDRAERTAFVVFFAATAAVFGWFVLLPLLAPLVMAVLTAVICRPAHERVERLLGRATIRSALSSTLLLTVLVGVPAFNLGQLFLEQARTVLNELIGPGQTHSRLSALVVQATGWISELLQTTLGSNVEAGDLRASFLRRLGVALYERVPDLFAQAGRWTVGVVLFYLLLAGLGTCGICAAGGTPARMIILGVDGMDPKLLQQYMDEGRMPNLSRLAATGGFMPLQTSMPAQSPVAWSTFITGLDPGGHGIFDFLHLDRATLTPYMSTSRIHDASITVPVGRWRVPLGSQKIELLRRGTAFWELLENHGVRTRLFQMPANYPPVETSGRAISGMGTPDLQGTSGVFTLFTDTIPHLSESF